MALHRVVVGGYPRDAWRNNVNALVLDWVYALLLRCWAGPGVVPLIGTSQRPLAARLPLRIGLFLSVMLTSWLRSRCIRLDVKMAVQLESQASPMDSKGACKFGTRWHSVALLGRGKGRYPLEVAVLEWRLAEVIEMPFGVGCSWSRGVFGSARLIVQPVSAAMVGLVLGIGLGLEIAWLL